jgi:hypothetical protein
MAKSGASLDPKWVENEIEMLERTLAMYKAYAVSAKDKEEEERWRKNIEGIEHRISHAKEKLEKARKQYALKAGV